MHRPNIVPPIDCCFDDNMKDDANFVQDDARGVRREDVDNLTIRDFISNSIERAVNQIHQAASSSASTTLREAIAASISFPNKQTSVSNTTTATNPPSILTGKPYDIELRIALKWYHLWKLQSNECSADHDNKDATALESHSPDQRGNKSKIKSSSKNNAASIVVITSDLSLSREISSPRQLAEILVPLLEDDIRQHPRVGLAPDVRCQPSGVISLITWKSSQNLRYRLGMLPCPHCIKWCKGEKGIWWHQQLHHRQEHAIAAAVAQATKTNEDAIVIYQGYVFDHSNRMRTLLDEGSSNSQNSMTDPFDCIRNGNLDSLRLLVKSGKCHPSTSFDRKGATPLMWAAGGGHLEIVRYLLEACQCDPSQPQRGKRSFAGRTALHWAARNGHLPVVQYLLSTATEASARRELIEAATGDGTTAFGWACWQRHLDVMEYLHKQGCVVDGVNSFGCSPLLWCSQGDNGDGLSALRWLQSLGCDTYRVNNNGHGILHKAAQRGQQDVAEWLMKELMEIFETIDSNKILALIGPDVEGYCPSDLAGMEGHETLASLLANTEIHLCQKLQRSPSFDVPEEFAHAHCTGIAQSKEKWTFEKYGGLGRIRASLSLHQ
ncbi:MAG: hypothetical protein SGILL_001641 [Bacillariaceae sp.]